MYDTQILKRASNGRAKRRRPIGKPRKCWANSIDRNSASLLGFRNWRMRSMVRGRTSKMGCRALTTKSLAYRTVICVWEVEVKFELHEKHFIKFSIARAIQCCAASDLSQGIRLAESLRGYTSRGRFCIVLSESSRFSRHEGSSFQGRRIK